MKRQHIFLVFHNFGLGGVQKKILDLANFITQSPDYKNTICHLLIRDKTKFNFENKLIKNNQRIKIHYSPQLSIYSFYGFKHLNYGVDLFKQIIRYRPTNILLFLHFSLPFIVIAKIVFFWKKFSLTLSQDNILSLYNKKKYTKRVFPNWTLKIMYKFSDKIIVQTKFAKNDLIKNYDISKNKIKIIQNWVIKNQDKPKKKNRTYDFIYCGRFAPQKNLPLMIGAMKSIVKKKPSSKLLLIGDGSQKSHLEWLVKKLHLEKNIEFINSNHHINDYLYRSKIFLLTSDFEGHPMILLEAMAAGVVPLVLNYPGVNEYIKHGKTGLIATNQSSLAREGVKLLEDKSLLTMISREAKRITETKNNESLIKETISQVC